MNKAKTGQRAERIVTALAHLRRISRSKKRLNECLGKVSITLRGSLNGFSGPKQKKIFFAC